MKNFCFIFPRQKKKIKHEFLSKTSLYINLRAEQEMRKFKKNYFLCEFN